MGCGQRACLWLLPEHWPRTGAPALCLFLPLLVGQAHGLPAGDPQQKQPTPKAPSEGHRHTSCKKPRPSNPHNWRWGRPAPGVASQPPGSPLSPRGPLPAPGVPSQPLASPLRPQGPLSAPSIPSQPPASSLSPQGPLSAPGIPSQPPGVPLRPLPQSQRPCLCSHVSSILTQPLPWPCPEPPDASGRGLHTLAPRTPLVILLRAQPGVTLSSEVTAAARLSLLKDPALAAPQEQAERGPGAQSHSPHDLPEPNLPRLREEGAWCALV